MVRALVGDSTMIRGFFTGPSIQPGSREGKEKSGSDPLSADSETRKMPQISLISREFYNRKAANSAPCAGDPRAHMRVYDAYACIAHTREFASFDEILYDCAQSADSALSNNAVRPPGDEEE